ncbi:WD40 repeat domain-containing serine/threonine protein kinase [Nocardiopsis nanhaiensis]
MHPLTPSDPGHIGPHRLLSRLGAGGMGEVYLARTPAGRLAALKVVKQDLARDHEFRSRFAREVRTAQMVAGPFTPDVVDADPDSDTPWMATEYVPGPTLSKALRENGPFPEDSLRVLAIGLARALQAIHGAGLMHRDLKPDNVLLSPRGPQVIDFGIARAVEGTVLTKTGQGFGTPSYTSPEQIMGHETSRASDVFSLAGVVTYAATGRAPFGSGRAPEVLPRVVSADPTLDDVPESIRPLLARCLAKDPAERPTSDDIVRALSDRPLPSAEHGWLPAQVNHSINAHQNAAHQAVHAARSGSDQSTTGLLNAPPKKRRTGLIAAGAGAAALVLAAGVGLAAVAPWSDDEAATEEAEGEADNGGGSDGDQDDSAAEGGPDAGIDGFINHVTFTPDGSGVYVHADQVTLWDWESGELQHSIEPRPHSVAPADDGVTAVGYNDSLEILGPDLEGIDSFTVDDEDPEDVIDYGTTAITPDGSTVAVTVYLEEGERLYLWDRGEDTVRHTLDLGEAPSHVEFSADGGHLMLDYLNHYPQVELYEVDTFDQVAAMAEEVRDDTPEYGTEQHSAALSPTEPLMAVDVSYGDIELYDYEEDEVVGEIEWERSHDRLAFSSDGQTLYSAGTALNPTGGPSGGRAWDVATGEELTTGDTLLVDRVATHPDGEAVATFARDNTLVILDPETLDVINEMS